MSQLNKQWQLVFFAKKRISKQKKEKEWQLFAKLCTGHRDHSQVRLELPVDRRGQLEHVGRPLAGRSLGGGAQEGWPG